MDSHISEEEMHDSKRQTCSTCIPDAMKEVQAHVDHAKLYKMEASGADQW